MRTLAEDTHPEAEHVLIELLRSASPARRIAMVLDANRSARKLALTGLRERHPNDSPARLRRAFGRALAWPRARRQSLRPIARR